MIGAGVQIALGAMIALVEGTHERAAVMKQVNIKIGSLEFDHADYDAEGDVLYLHAGAPRKAEGEETPDGHVLRFAPGTHRIVGLTLLGTRAILDQHGELRVTIPASVKATADDLAPAMAAT